MSTERGRIGLGHSEGGPLWVSKEARDVHMQVLGLSRVGKSYFLEHMIRQDIASGAGVCVIDPHGELYDNLVAWLAANEVQKRRRIHLINPAAGQWAVGFNPLCRSREPIGARVSSMLSACQRVWDDDASKSFATTRRLLNMIFTTLAHNQLSLREADLLSTLPNRDVRNALVERTGDRQLIDLWAQEDAKGDAELAQTLTAVNNRMWDLTRSPGVMSMIGQTEKVIDFRVCMEHQHIVLVNLNTAGKTPQEVGQILGALITADLDYRAKSRKVAEAKDTPFYCYIDECGDYLNETIVKGLDQTAKFGLHYILSHQGLDQLGEPHDKMRRGVMRGAQNKIVFLQDDPLSAAEMGDFLFEKEFDLERPKQVLIKPTVVGYEREWLEREARSSGSFDAHGTGATAAAGLAESMVIDDEDGLIRTTNTLNEATSENAAWGINESYSLGRAETLVPIFEDLPGGTYSLDELKHEAKVKVRMLQARQAYAYTADDRRAVQFCTPDLYPADPLFEQLDAFTETIRKREPYCKPTAEVEKDVERRAHDLGVGGDELLGAGDGYD